MTRVHMTHPWRIGYRSGQHMHGGCQLALPRPAVVSFRSICRGTSRAQRHGPERRWPWPMTAPVSSLPASATTSTIARTAAAFVLWRPGVLTISLLFVFPLGDGSAILLLLFSGRSDYLRGGVMQTRVIRAVRLTSRDMSVLVVSNIEK